MNGFEVIQIFFARGALKALPLPSGLNRVKVQESERNKESLEVGDAYLKIATQDKTQLVSFCLHAVTHWLVDTSTAHDREETPVLLSLHHPPYHFLPC